VYSGQQIVGGYVSDSGGDGEWTWDGTNTYDGSFQGQNYSSEGHSWSHYHGHWTADNTSGDGGTFTEAGSTGVSGSTSDATYHWYYDGWSNGERTDTTDNGGMPMWDGTQWVPHMLPPTVKTFENDGEMHDTCDWEDHGNSWSVYSPQGSSSGSGDSGWFDATWDRHMHVKVTVTGPWENSVTEWDPMNCHGTWHDTWNTSMASSFVSGSTMPAGMSRSWSYTHEETDGGNPPTVTNSTTDSGSESSGTPPTPPANAGQGGTWVAPTTWIQTLNNLLNLTNQAYNNQTNVNQYVGQALSDMDTFADPDTPTTPVMQKLGDPTGDNQGYQPFAKADAPTGQGQGSQEPGVVVSTIDGAFIGLARVGQGLWALPRWLGLTKLIGIESTLQEADERMERKRRQIFDKGSVEEALWDLGADEAAVGLGYFTVRPAGPARLAAEAGKTVLNEGQVVLAIVKDGKVIAQTFDASLSHAQFVARTVGELPEGARVVTVLKQGRRIYVLDSRGIHGAARPSPQSVIDAILAIFR
jgi:hypothetical protein